MIRQQSTKQWYQEAKQSGKPGVFVRDMLHYMGLVDRNGRRYLDHAGNARIQDPVSSTGKPVERFRPSEFSLRDLAESVIGEAWDSKLSPSMTQKAELFGQSFPIMEAGTGAISASQFADINAFTAVVAGLLEISVLEAFRNPDFIADQLMPAQTTRMFDGRKVIGVGRIGDAAEVRQPGMPTARINIAERWVQQPRTVENALSAEVTQEAVFLDLTGQVLSEASDVGTWLAFRKELRCIDCFIGVTSTYVYNGTSYSTFLGPASFYVNDIASNELLHWDAIQQSLLTFREMTDPTTGTRVLSQPDTILVNMEKLVVAESIVGRTGGPVQYRDAPGSTSNPQEIREFQTPYAGKFKILTSPLVYGRCIDATGLNLSATAAGKIWWMWQSKGQGQGPFVYAQNWPLRVQQAAPGQMDLIDRGVVLYIKADERGVPMVMEPRKITRNKA